MINKKFPILLLAAVVLNAPGPGRADTLDLSGSSQSGDEFGFSATAGDFNCDEYEDLAIGAPREDHAAGGVDTGAVSIIYGGTGAGGRLGTSGNQVFAQGHFTVAGPQEYFGWALAAGDFNNDGCDDLAIGIRRDKFRGVAAGGVLVVYGATSGFQAGLNNEFWDQDSPGVNGGAEDGDNFGAALATGDFDNDGYDDLAIGAPGEEVGGVIGAGAVNVLYGSASRLTASGNQLFSSAAGLAGDPMEYEKFGEELAVGDFDNNGYDDLAIGLPGRDFLGDINAGAVRVLYGNGSAGLSAENNQLWKWGSPALAGDSDRPFYQDSYFGRALAAGDFNGDNRDDLAIGIPGYFGGAIHILFSGTTRLTTADTQYLHRDSTLIEGTRVPGEDFAETLAAGKFNNGARADLLVGVPDDILDENIIETRQAGTVHVLYGSLQGITYNNDIILSQNDVGPYSEPEWGDNFGEAVACGDFNGDGFKDAVIGVPLEDSASGVVHILYGSALGINAADHQMLRQ